MKDRYLSYSLRVLEPDFAFRVFELLRFAVLLRSSEALGPLEPREPWRFRLRDFDLFRDIPPLLLSRLRLVHSRDDSDPLLI